MPVKKRKLSPSASSHSSATPAPAQAASPSAASRPAELDTASPSAETTAPAALVNGSLTGNGYEQTRGKVLDERTVAKPGVVVIGSGDGRGCGDECYLWGDLPMNKNGFRYIPCGPSPNPSPSQYYPFYRSIPFPPPTPPVHISWLDRSHFLRLSSDGLTATTDRGFRSGRANIPVREGTWYFECRVLRGNAGEGSSKGSGLVGEGGNAHVRVGWGRREANLDAPIGSDGYGYGLRDVNGDKIHFSRPRPYASLASVAAPAVDGGVEGPIAKTFGTGDVVGCLISLPKRQPDTASGTLPPLPPVVQRKRFSIRYRGQNYFEMDDFLPQKEMEGLIDREGKMGKARLEAEQAGLGAVDVDEAGASMGKEAEKLAGNGSVPKGKKVKNTKKGKPEVKTETATQADEQPRSRPLPRLRGSQVEFFINGQSLGPAFENVYDYLPLPPIPATPRKGHGHGHSHSHSAGTAHEKEARYDDGTLGYYPMISCFGRGKAQLNFGPQFDYPLPGSARPMSERWAEYAEEECVLDERDEAEARVRLEEEMDKEKQRRAVVDAKNAKKGLGPKKGGGVGGSPLSGQAQADDARKRKTGTGTPTPAPVPGPSGLHRSTTPALASSALSGLGIKESMNNLTPESTPAPEGRAATHDDIGPEGKDAVKEEDRNADVVMGSTPASPDAQIDTPSKDGTPVAGKGGESKGKIKGKKGKKNRGSGNASRPQSRSASRVTSTPAEADIKREQETTEGMQVDDGDQRDAADTPAEGEEREIRGATADAEGDEDSEEEGIQWD